MTMKRVASTYFVEVRAFPLRKLKSDAEHARALEVLTRLMGTRDRGRSDYLEVLIQLIVEYEHRRGWGIDISAITAADAVRHRLEARGMTISALAREIGVAQSNLSDMLNGRRAWSKNAIRALSAKFDIAAERFLTKGKPKAKRSA